MSNMMSSCGSNVSGVITQGGVCYQISEGNWVGSECDIKPFRGYWIIVDNFCELCIEDAIPTDPEIQYHFIPVANLISFPSNGTIHISDALPDDVEEYVTGIITQGGACYQISDGYWVGSECYLEGGNGYWFMVTDYISFSFDLSELSRSIMAYKEEKLSGYEYNQSSKQAFYFVESIEGIKDGDYILAYNGDKLIVSR